jgi:glutathionylspermidine synthase
MSNPGRAIILQSKRFPLVWDRLSCGLPTWRRLLPQATAPDHLRDVEYDDWVFKPAFGRVGEDVGIRGINPEHEFRSIVRSMKENSSNWVAQRRFKIIPVPSETGPVYPCVGVYTVGGKVAGLYGRVSTNPLIDGNAQDVAVLLKEEAN